MKKLLILLFLIGFLLFNSLAVTAQESLDFNFPENNWKLGFKDIQKNSKMFEFIKNSENIDNWNELITVQTFNGLQNKTTPDLFLLNLMNLIKKNSDNLSYKIIHNSPKDVIIKWQVKQNGLIDTQCELVRAISGKENMYVIHYAVKKSNIPDEEKWLYFIKSAKISAHQD
jgi:hypothetical protein